MQKWLSLAVAATIVLTLVPASSAFAGAVRRTPETAPTESSGSRAGVNRGVTASTVHAAATDIPGADPSASPILGSLSGTNDNGVYRIWLRAGETISFSLTGAGGTDFDLYLFDPAAASIFTATAVASSAGLTYPESISDYAATASGFYNIAVHSYSGSGSFTLTYSITSSDSNVPGVIPPTQPVSGFVASTYNPNDVFKMFMYEGQTLSATLNKTADQDVQLWLFPPGTTNVDSDPGSSSISPAASSLTLTRIIPAGQSGLQYLNPWATPGAASAYTLNWSGYDGDVPAIPLPASPVSRDMLSTSNSDDVYAVGLTAGQTLNLSLAMTAPDADLYLFGPGTGSVFTDSFLTRSNNSGTTGESISYVAPASGTYYIDIYQYSGPTAYTLTYNVVTPAPPPPPPPTPAPAPAPAPAPDPAPVLLPKLTLLSTPWKPTSLRYGRGFTSYGYVKPRHTAGLKSARILAYRYESGKWRLKKTIYPTNYNYSTYTKYSGYVKPPYKGWWVLRAYAPADSRHRATYSAYSRSFRVY